MSDNTREVVGPGKFVTYSYKLYNDANGELLFEATSKAPDEMVYLSLIHISEPTRLL